MKLIKIDKDRWINATTIDELKLEGMAEEWLVTLILNASEEVVEVFRYGTEEAARSKLNDILSQARATK